MKLYEIDEEILACVDSESGEILDAERFEALQMERDAKVENVALWIKNLKSDLVALEAERKAFQDREKSCKAKIASLQNWLSFALNGQKFSSPKVAVSFRRTESVEIVDESILPKEFVREKIELAPDKVAIKDAIKRGETVSGAALIQNQSVQIK